MADIKTLTVAEYDELVDALRGVMGLVQLIDGGAGKADPDRVPHVTNHRYVEAERVLAKHEAQS